MVNRFDNGVHKAAHKADGKHGCLRQQRRPTNQPAVAPRIKNISLSFFAHGFPPSSFLFTHKQLPSPSPYPNCSSSSWRPLLPLVFFLHSQKSQKKFKNPP
jgi:hypothetical protein